MKETMAIGIIIGAVSTFLIGVFFVFLATLISPSIPTGSEVTEFSSPTPHASDEFRFRGTHIANEPRPIEDSVANETRIGDEYVAKTAFTTQHDTSDQDEIQVIWNESSTKIQELTVQIDALTSKRERYRTAHQELESGYSDAVDEFQKEMDELDSEYGTNPSEEEIREYLQEISDRQFALADLEETYIEESRRLVELINETTVKRRELYNERLLLENILEGLDSGN